MVGTSAVVAFFAFRLSRARRTRDRRMIMGLRGHLGSVSGVGRLRALRRGRRPYQGRCFAAKPAHADYTVDLDEHLPEMCNEHRHVAPRMQLVIEAWTINH